METWLTSETGDAELQFPGYQITRHDRQYYGHGGILLYTREGIDVQRRDDPMLDDYEDALWCDISSPGSELDILLGIVYRIGVQISGNFAPGYPELLFERVPGTRIFVMFPKVTLKRVSRHPGSGTC